MTNEQYESLKTHLFLIVENNVTELRKLRMARLVSSLESGPIPDDPQFLGEVQRLQSHARDSAGEILKKLDSNSVFHVAIQLAIDMVWLRQTFNEFREMHKVDDAKARSTRERYYVSLQRKREYEGRYYDTKSELRRVSAVVQQNRAARQKGANAIHAENRKMKEDVFRWLELNFEAAPKISRAADQIAGKIVPISWRTAYKWTQEWKRSKS